MTNIEIYVYIDGKKKKQRSQNFMILYEEKNEDCLLYNDAKAQNILYK